MKPEWTRTPQGLEAQLDLGGVWRLMVIPRILLGPSVGRTAQGEGSLYLALLPSLRFSCFFHVLYHKLHFKIFSPVSFTDDFFLEVKQYRLYIPTFFQGTYTQ